MADRLADSPVDRPPNLFGDWTPEPPDEHGYVYHRAGGVAVRFHPGYEPDGEMVAGPLTTAHMEQMGAGSWSLILTQADGPDIHVNLHSKKRIDVLWREEG